METNTLDRLDQSGPTKGIVPISIDGIEYKILAGEHKVSELKVIGNVPSDYALSELIEGQFRDLDDSKTVKIKGGELFSSHPRSGGSS